MRLIALDTETTGLNRRRGAMAGVSRGHRIIEIGCIEIIDGRITGRRFHRYVDPGQPIDIKAIAIHGITDAFLKGKPVFSDIAKELIDFIGTSDIIIHNAPFDTEFLDKEFSLLDERDQPNGRIFTVIDTLQFSRMAFPGGINTLDGLGVRYGIEGRTTHGALSDAIMLAKIYILMLS